jgi:nicotinate-nucleotide adenylyltransferase
MKQNVKESKTLCVFGGAFDPPHHGHINLVNAVKKNLKPDKVIIIPTGNAPHKETLTDYGTRIKLAQSAFIASKISDIESKEDVCYTVDTLRELKKRHPDSELQLVIGTDMLESFDEWKDAKEIQRLCRLVVVPRKGTAKDYKELAYKYAAKLLDIDVVDISSTQIREKFKKKRYAHSLNVAILCGELARHYKLSKDLAEKVYIAGLYHDIEKHIEKTCRTFPEWLENEYGADPLERAERKLWHGIAGAVYVRDVLKISDPDILNAIRFHTVARPCMSVVEKIVYVADKASPERVGKDYDKIRELAFKNLDEALYESIMMLKRGMQLPACAEAACACYEKIVKGEN